MTFSDTYRQEVFQTRKIRSQRIGILTKIVSLMLVLVAGAALRSEPQLRVALFEAGVDFVNGASSESSLPQNRLPQNTQSTDTQGSADQLGKTLSGIKAGKVGQ